MQMPQTLETRWCEAVATGELGLWDLRPELETVHHSPPWKRRLGFPDPQAADSTHFWRCRVHPEDLGGMLEAMRAHARGDRPLYEASFRLRSNGSGYRLLHSRGRIVARDAQGRVERMVGTMIDLTGRAFTPRSGLAEETHEAPQEAPGAPLPLHLVLCPAQGAGPPEAASQRLQQERGSLLAAMEDLLHAALAELDEQPRES